MSLDNLKVGDFIKNSDFKRKILGICGEVYKVGDFIKNENFKRKILGICGEVYFVSPNNPNYHDFYGLATTLKELQEQGYEKVEPELLKIELGKFYLTRDNKRAFVIEKREMGPYYFIVYYNKDNQRTVTTNGLVFQGEERADDLVKLHDNQSF